MAGAERRLLHKIAMKQESRLIPQLAPSGWSWRWLARCTWRKRKGGFARRTARRLRVIARVLAGAPGIANTSCTMLLGTASFSSVPFPP